MQKRNVDIFSGVMLLLLSVMLALPSFMQAPYNGGIVGSFVYVSLFLCFFSSYIGIKLIKNKDYERHEHIHELLSYKGRLALIGFLLILILLLLVGGIPVWVFLGLVFYALHLFRQGCL